VSDGQDGLETYYNWRQSQATTLASACFTLSGLILSPLLAAVFDPKAEIATWHLSVYLPGTTAAALAGLLGLRKASRLHDEYREMISPANSAEAERGVPKPGEVTWA
jgi:hypothetical protein